MNKKISLKEARETALNFMKKMDDERNKVMKEDFEENVCPNCGCSGRMQQHIPTDDIYSLDKYFKIWIFCSDENCGRKVYGKCLHGNASEMI